MFLTYLMETRAGNMVLAIQYGGNIAEWHPIVLDMPLPETPVEDMVFVGVSEPDRDITKGWKFQLLGGVIVSPSTLCNPADFKPIDFFHEVAAGIVEGSNDHQMALDALALNIKNNFFDSASLDLIAASDMPTEIAKVMIEQRRAPIH